MVSGGRCGAASDIGFKAPEERSESGGPRLVSVAVAEKTCELVGDERRERRFQVALKHQCNRYDGID